MKFYKIFSWWEWLICFFLFLSILFLIVFYFKVIKSSPDYKGIQSFKNKNFAQAQRHFNQALIRKPFVPWNYINLAVSQDRMNATEKALKNYDIASSLHVKKSLLADFFSYFNKGELSGRLNQMDEALENYQKALEFRYKEQIIKKNIELLFKDQKRNEEKKSQKGNKGGDNQQGSSEDQKEQGGDSSQKLKEEQQKQSEKQKSMENQQESSQGQKRENNQQGLPDREGRAKKQKEQLTEHQQKAILEEVEKQENKIRSRFYRGQTIFGDKTQKDW